MRISNGAGSIDFEYAADNDNVEKKAAVGLGRNMYAGPSVLHINAAVKTSGDASLEQRGQGILELAKTAVNGFNSFKGMLLPNPSVSAQAPGSALAGNVGKGIFGFIKGTFTALINGGVGAVVNFFKGLFSPTPIDVSPVNPAPFTPSPVTPALDNVLPYSPDKPSGKKPNDIWGGFHQGPDGNCVTVSAIKAAMMKFGQKPTDIFTDVKKVDKGYEVVMRDGFKLQLSESELRQASQAAKFKGHDQEMISDANFLFAVSAKRAQLENNDNVASRSFTHAIRTLNDGEHPREGLMRLGLKEHIRSVPVTSLQNGMIGTVEYGGHSMAVIGGSEERYGRRGGTPPRHAIATGLV